MKPWVSLRRVPRRSLGLAILVLLIASAGAWALKTTSEQKLMPILGESNYEVGWAVDLDGGIAVLGAPQDSTVASEAGAVYVYSIANGAFVETATITASDAEAGDELGISVDIDGDTLAAGAEHRWSSLPEPGSAYVFGWDGANWTEQAKLTAPDGIPKDAFGWSIALDGDFLAVGAPRAWSGGPTGGGAVYTYQRIDGVWTFNSKLSRGSDHSFGWSLDMDGDTLVVGSSLQPNERVTVYTRDGDGDWNLQATLTALDTVGNDFGNDVALDEDNLVVGAWGDTENGNYGAAYFFVRHGLTWSQIQKVNSQGGERSENFGEAVAINGDLALITDSGRDLDDDYPDVGAAYLYRRTNSGWTAAGTIMPSDYQTYTDYFGTAAALQGSRLLIGAAYAWDEPSESWPGGAYTYQVARGSKLVIKNNSPDNEYKNRIVFVGKDLVTDVPIQGSPDDPTCGGGATASIEVSSSTSGESFSQALPCANWEVTPSGYRYRDPQLDDGPCRLIIFAPGHTTKAVCSGAGPSVLDFDLESGVDQVPIGVKLTLGTASYCASFGGTIKADGTDGTLFNAVNSGGMEPCS